MGSKWGVVWLFSGGKWPPPLDPPHPGPNSEFNKLWCGLGVLFSKFGVLRRSVAGKFKLFDKKLWD